MMAWKLEEALAVVRDFEDKLKPEYHCALAGSVLMKGESAKDLDVIVYPHSTKEDPIHSDVLLSLMGLSKAMAGVTEMSGDWANLELVKPRNPYDTKEVAVCSLNGRRVDVFFLT